jgi:2-oxoglutarate/2-oxoacid ferredoxin oxidoreductase subunit beta
MPALVAGIHVFLTLLQDVDGRVKPGHDGLTVPAITYDVL